MVIAEAGELWAGAGDRVDGFPASAWPGPWGGSGAVRGRPHPSTSCIHAALGLHLPWAPPGPPHPLFFQPFLLAGRAASPGSSSGVGSTCASSESTLGPHQP